MGASAQAYPAWSVAFSLGIGGVTLAAPGGGILGLNLTTLLIAAIIISTPGLYMAWQGG